MPEQPGQEADFIPAVNAAELLDPGVADKISELERRLDEAHPTFEHWSQELAPSIREGRWDAIISDERSGRLPSLFVGRMVSRWNRAHDLPAPTRLFVGAGGIGGDHTDSAGDIDLRATWRVDYDDWASNKQADLVESVGESDRHFERALIVSEYTNEGHSIDRLQQALNESGIKTDVAVFEAQMRHPFINNYLQGHDAGRRIIIGRHGLTGDDATFYSSVMKQATESFRLPGQVTVERNVYAPRELTLAARHKIEALADEMYDKFVKEPPPDA